MPRLALELPGGEASDVQVITPIRRYPDRALIAGRRWLTPGALSELKLELALGPLDRLIADGTASTDSRATPDTLRPHLREFPGLHGLACSYAQCFLVDHSPYLQPACRQPAAW